jgi:ribosome biogenesis protein NSA2
MDEHRKRHGRRLDHEERKCASPASSSLSHLPGYRRKRTAREAHKASADTQKMVGHKAKLMHKKRHSEKVQMKKTLKAFDERNTKQKDDGAVKEGALPAYLLDREGQKVSCSLRLEHPAHVV